MDPEFINLYIEKLNDEVNVAVKEKVVLLATVEYQKKQLAAKEEEIEELKSLLNQIGHVDPEDLEPAKRRRK
jgi:hypothetical protein